MDPGQARDDAEVPRKLSTRLSLTHSNPVGPHGPVGFFVFAVRFCADAFAFSRPVRALTGSTPADVLGPNPREAVASIRRPEGEAAFPGPEAGQGAGA